MINKFKYIGYDEDGVEAYLCLHCYDIIKLRHHHSVQILQYCPFCGCHFDGAFIKNNNNKFLQPYDWYGHTHYKSALYDAKQSEFRLIWEVQSRSTLYYDEFDAVRTKQNGDDGWETAYDSTSDDDNKFKFYSREWALTQFRYLIQKWVKEETNSFLDREEIEFRLKYSKDYINKPTSESYITIAHYYPKNNKITKKQKQRRKVSA